MRRLSGGLEHVSGDPGYRTGLAARGARHRCQAGLL